MKNWDFLEFQISTTNSLNFLCTNAEEIIKICEQILRDGVNYFEYVNTAGKHKLEIRGPCWTKTGHHAILYISPYTSLYSPELRYDDNIHHDDLWIFVLKTISSNNWDPYPGDGTGTRFIKYSER